MMIEGSGSMPLTNGSGSRIQEAQKAKTYGYNGSGFGSATLVSVKGGEERLVSSFIKI